MTEKQREYFRQYYQRNKEKVAARHKERAEEIAAYQREYMKRYVPEHHDELREQKHEWYLEHREEVIARSKEYTRNSTPEQKEKRKLSIHNWEITHREKKCASSAKRRAFVVAAQQGSPEAIQAIYDRAGGDEVIPCHYCSAPTTNTSRHVDHVIPLSRGGPHSADNLVIACASCNLSKNRRTPEEWSVTCSISAA